MYAAVKSYLVALYVAYETHIHTLTQSYNHTCTYIQVITDYSGDECRFWDEIGYNN